MSQLKICPQCGSEYELDQRFCPKDGTTLRTQNTGGDLVGEIVADRYHVLRKLGEGGMGQVYLAEHVKMGRKSAVKVLHPGMVNDSDAISRFNREASNASRITHPHVAAVYDFGETPDGLIYLAMEFVEGEPLTKLIERLGALPPARAAEIARQTADALAAAHDMGIVHRDLKPDNIMIARNRDGSDCVKVVDFGIAKAGEGAAQKVTKTGLVIGTPEYMSPEQLAGDKLDGRSDTYSLALVTFNMLTGKLPFPGETVQEAMIMRLTDRPKSLAEMRPGVTWPAELQAALDRALARDAASRYTVATEFARDLVRAVQSMPTTRAAELSTSVVEAVPPTVVRPAAAAMAPAAAPSQPPLPDATRVAPARAATPAPNARRTGMLAAAALGVVVVVGGAAWAALGARDEASAASNEVRTPVTGDTANARTASADSLQQRTTSSANDVATPGAGQLASGTTTRSTGATGAVTPPGTGATAAAPRAGTVTPPAGGSSVPGVDASSQLAELDRLADPVRGSEDDARRAISMANRLLPRLTTPEERVAARYAQGNAFLILNQPENACKVFREARNEARGTALERSVEAYFTADQAPCQ